MYRNFDALSYMKTRSNLFLKTSHHQIDDFHQINPFFRSCNNNLHHFLRKEDKKITTVS